MGTAAHHALHGRSDQAGDVPVSPPPRAAQGPVPAGKATAGPWEPQTAEKSGTSPALGRLLDPNAGDAGRSF